MKANAVEVQGLIKTLKERFIKHPHRHASVEWSLVQKKLDANPKALAALLEMERTGGEPDVIGSDTKADALTFCDCAAESPKDRRSLCYDKRALDSRKENKPKGSAVERAAAMGVELLTEAEYQALQQLGDFDLKTSSWLKTPDDIRKHGGALFGDKRYGRAFTYHNGAESYYAARGFRGRLVLS
jgi:hypothetical protein